MSIFRDPPCERCGWKFNTFHICLDLSKPCAGEQQSVQNNAGKGRGSATKARYDAIHKENAERDAAIAADYMLGDTYSSLAEKYNLHRHVIGRILRRLATNGQVVVRPAGSKPPNRQKENA